MSVNSNDEHLNKVVHCQVNKTVNNQRTPAEINLGKNLTLGVKTNRNNTYFRLNLYSQNILCG